MRIAKRWAPFALIICQAAFAFAVVLRAVPPAAAAPNRRARLSEKLRTRLPIKEWKYIVVHHSATAEGNAERFDRYHREYRGWKDGLAYHFVIGNGRGSGDGEIETGLRWLDQKDGAHCRSAEYNKYGIGICLVGDFTNSAPTGEQMKSLAALCRSLMNLCGIGADNVIGHREVPGAETECPGALFPMAELRAKLKKE